MPLYGFDGMASDMKIDRCCHCGYITYEAEVDLANVRGNLSGSDSAIFISS